MDFDLQGFSIRWLGLFELLLLLSTERCKQEEKKLAKMLRRTTSPRPQLDLIMWHYHVHQILLKSLTIRRIFAQFVNGIRSAFAIVHVRRKAMAKLSPLLLWKSRENCMENILNMRCGKRKNGLSVFVCSLGARLTGSQHTQKILFSRRWKNRVLCVFGVEFSHNSTRSFCARTGDRKKRIYLFRLKRSCFMPFLETCHFKRESWIHTPPDVDIVGKCTTPKR